MKFYSLRVLFFCATLGTLLITYFHLDSLFILRIVSKKKGVNPTCTCCLQRELRTPTMCTRATTISPFTSDYIKFKLWQTHCTLPPHRTFLQYFRKQLYRRAGRTKTFVRCWEAEALLQHSFRRSIRLAGSRWKEGACSTSLKVFLVGLGFAERVTWSTGPSFSHGRGSAAADIAKASINSWPIPIGTSCTSRPVDTSHTYTPKTFFLLTILSLSLFHSFFLCFIIEIMLGPLPHNFTSVQVQRNMY